MKLSPFINFVGFRPAGVVFLLSVCFLSSSVSAQVDVQELGKLHKAAPKQVLPKQSEKHLVPTARGRINLGAGVNSGNSELFPVITPDEMVLFFARKGDPSNAGFANNPLDEDIWYSTRTRTGGWSNAYRLPGMLNTENYDGVRAINTQGTHLYLQNIYREDGTRNKGFSMSTKQPDGSWSFPDSLIINGYYNDASTAMMSVSTDEEYIIFSLVRKDSKGQHDLYVSHRTAPMTYSEPEQIAELSTAGDDISPFIAFDDRTLYFSTDGLPGLGSHDIFLVRRLDDTWKHWTAPMNMGAPVNTPSFDAYFMVAASGDTAYFSSADGSSTSGYGKSDIWKVGLEPFQRPGFWLPTADWEPSGDREVDSLASAMFRLDKVLFDVDKATIRPESKQSLDSLAQIIISYPKLAFQIQGHTDGDGNPAHNMALSQTRAESVCTYLRSLGVPFDQVSAKGYGQTRPIAPNTSNAGKQLNRRVMVLVSRRGAPQKLGAAGQ